MCVSVREYVICVRGMCVRGMCTWYVYVICVRGGQYTGMALYVSMRVFWRRRYSKRLHSILYIFYYFRIYSDICPLYTGILHYILVYALYTGILHHVYWSIIY